MSLDPTSFIWVADLVKREAAISLEVGKEYLVESRLAPLALKAGCKGVDEYVRQLRVKITPQQRNDIVEAMTTNETSWFRDREPFDVLINHMLPDLLTAPNPRRHLNIWSAACSSGQEAYTISMLLQEHLPPGWTYSILATDISREMLARVDAAEYNQLEVGRGLPAQMMVKNFDRVGTHWRIKDVIRKTVKTQFLNLAQPFPPMPEFDVVFLRNVLIYFEVATKADILRRVRRLTKPGGYLFLGAAETTIGVDDGWERHTLPRSSMIRNPDPSRPLAPQAGAAGAGGRTRGPSGGVPDGPPGRPPLGTRPATLPRAGALGAGGPATPNAPTRPGTTPGLAGASTTRPATAPGTTPGANRPGTTRFTPSQAGKR